MNYARVIIVLALIPLLAGCDVAVGVYFATKKKSSNSSSAPLPSISIVASDATASEAGGNTGEFTITRTGSTAAALDVFFQVTGTAIEGTDYSTIGTQATILAGLPSVTVTVTPTNDAAAEGSTPETVILTLTATSNYRVTAPGTATVSIDDDDDDRYHVWVATLTGPEAATQETTLTGNGGNPDGLVWTEVVPVPPGTRTATSEFIPPAGMNTVMIQINDVQIYEIDSIEILDAAGNVVEWGVGTIYKARMSSTPSFDPLNFLGTPDGVVTRSAATAGNKAVIFTQFVGSIVSFRVNLWKPAARTSGDVVWAKAQALPNDQICGGVAVHSNGTTYLGFHDDTLPNHSVYAMSFDANGTASALTLVASGVTATVGGETVAIDERDVLPANHSVYVAATVAAGDIGIEKYSLAMVDSTPAAGTFFYKSGLTGVERVEANGLLVDGAGNVVVGGGVANLLSNIDHWMWKLDSTGAQQWLAAPSAPLDGSDTWWHGIAADSGNNLFGAGDLTNSGSLELYSQRVAASGTAGVSNTVPNTGQTDLGHSVGIDRSPTGNDDMLVAGYQTIAGQGKDGIILRYTNAGVAMAPFPVRHNGTANGDDEILDIAVDPADGAIYAVGYETVTGQGTNWWVRRYSQTGTVVWTRTHHHAGTGNAGNDRAVSVSLQGSFVIVAGEVTLTAGGKDIHVRKYVK